MTPEYYDLLPPDLKRLTDEIEKHCGFELLVKWTRNLKARGMLDHGPNSATIHLRTLPPDRTVICHEICHAERYLLLGVPFMQLDPPRQINGVEGDSINAADNLDNMIEHIIVLRDLKERFRIDKDPTHVRDDIAAHKKWPKDEFSRRCLALCNVALVHFHFPELSSEMRTILAAEGLTEVAQELTDSLQKSLHSKPQMIAALVKALEIREDEVHLRARTCRCDGFDFSRPLAEWLRDGLDRYTPEIEDRMTSNLRDQCRPPIPTENDDD